MRAGLRIAFFGSSLVSAYWNGAATYYRGLLRALAARGHAITFYEPDAFERQQHRDIDDPPWARVVVYSGSDGGAARRALDEARACDVVVKASGVGVFDELLEAGVASLRGPARTVIFWDVDAPATLERLAASPSDPLRPLLPCFDLVLTYGGGDPVVRAYRDLGAAHTVPIYNALDPTTHYPVPAEARFRADLAFLGNRLPDREARVRAFFFDAADAAPDRRFLLGGSGWDAAACPGNVRYVGHVYTRDHNAVNSTARAVLNVSRDSMARIGFSPATRVFEAAGAGACVITDAWDGLEQFLEPDREALVAHSGREVALHLASLTPARARQIGDAARQRLLAQHTYAHRAADVEAVVTGARARPAVGVS
jgi:spore maturation protein CgeB